MSISKSKIRPVVVTGARGFIGRELAAAMQSSGSPVIGTTRGPGGACFSRIDSVQIDLQHVDLGSLDAVRELIGRAEPKVIFHLSGLARPDRAREDPLQAFEANTRAVWTLMEGIRTTTPNTTLVMVTTAEQAGRRMDHSHPYVASKLAAEAVASSYATTYGLGVSVARLSHVYGPDDDEERLVTAIVAAKVARRQLKLKEPKRLFDLLFIEDAVAGLTAVAQATVMGEFKAFSITAGTFVSGEQVAALVSRLDDGAGVSRESASNPDPGPSAEHPPAWRPRVSLSTGLAATIAWHRDRLRERQHA